MAVQITDWGNIDWKEDNTGTRGNLRTGIVTLREHAHQPKHVHFEEQVIQVISGRALSSINGKEEILNPGMIRHWPAGVEHEIRNESDSVFQHLLVSNPGQYENVTLWKDTGESQEVDPSLIYEAVEAIRIQFLEDLHYSYVFFDTKGELILQSRHFPDYCEECCHPDSHPGSCPCMKGCADGDLREERSETCPFGMLVYQFPIIFSGQVIGIVQGGYLRYSSTEKGLIETVYDAPETMVAGVLALFSRIVKAVRNYCEFEQFRRTLLKKEESILNAKSAQDALMKNLQDTQYAVTDLRINHHFLFNTLNSMASIALDSGALTLYSSIVDLSKMFHYTLRHQQARVTLRNEWDYVRAYLDLQRLRYPDSLIVDTAFDEQAMETEVPFNFLQPIIENAFKHGFHDDPEKKLLISIKKAGPVIIEVTNSGRSLTEQEYAAVNRTIQSGVPHGLSLIYRKLMLEYEGQCGMKIRANTEGGSTVRIILGSSDG